MKIDHSMKIKQYSFCNVSTDETVVWHIIVFLKLTAGHGLENANDIFVYACLNFRPVK